jgi:hypothetical protein
MLLKLYELRREPRLRQAREWFVRHYHVQSLQEQASLTPEEDTNFRMTVSYWDMAAAFVRRGLVDEEMFFETSGEMWIVWDRVKALVGPVRERAKDPHIWENLEKQAVRFEVWRERRAPGCIAAMRQMMEQMARTAQASR